jgi:hypothetical protein
VGGSQGGDVGFVEKVSIWTAPATRNTLRLGLLAHESTSPSARPRVTRPVLARGTHVDGNRIG